MKNNLNNEARSATDVILNSVADGVFTVNKDWEITSFNRAAEEITGVKRDEAIGRKCCDVFRSNICENACALKKTMRTGRPIINQTIYIINANGQRLSISISTAILKDNQNNLIGGVETFRDLSIVEQLRKELQDKYTFADIVGRSQSMQQLFEILPEIARSDSTILLEGASGTGKEIFARAIHNLSSRRDKPFVPINCGALPDSLLESELFGYKAGAFTDARRDKSGRFAIAEGGTVFLDEIGDVSPAMQAKLLRVIQEKVFEPLGSNKPIKLDVRLVAATNKELSQLVKQGIFRDDLFYRINVFRIKLPDLQERREDIPLLIDNFISKFNRLKNKDIQGVSQEAMAILMEYEYPGNIRELENIIEHAYVLCRGGLIEPRYLPPVLRAQEKPGTWPGKKSLSLQAMEAYYIADAVRRHHGNRVAAAKDLGINPSTLFRKIKSLKIKVMDEDGRNRNKK
ncbi:sigma 54-interacting transcriptional regulator [bacterium]|nr:sigma 54-interacting transcriptional regulator [bacterium]